MSRIGFRITKTRYVLNAFSGEGARLYGGRWNSVGTRMVYMSGTLSGATLELLVHTDDYSTIAGLYSYIPVDIPDDCIEALDHSSLPVDWNSPIPNAATQMIGDHWITSSSSAILEVPSAITSGEFNFLGNPLHPNFSNLMIQSPRKFKMDPRI
jgi:RES domain-containing protein